MPRCSNRLDALQHPGYGSPPWEAPIRTLVPLLLLTACFPDDWDGQPYVPATTPVTTSFDSNDTGVQAPSLVGTWVSEGRDISDLFTGVPFFYVAIEVDFRADGTVNTEITDQDGAVYVTRGTYVIDDSTRPATIELAQTEPYIATLRGIYEVAGNELTYEVVQITPDYGFVPPTPESGFGSTSGPNLIPGINVQTYVRL